MRRNAPKPRRTDLRAEAPGGSRRRRKLSATRGESERLAVWLSRDLATRLRGYAAENRLALSAAVEKALSAYLNRKRT